MNDKSCYVSKVAESILEDLDKVFSEKFGMFKHEEYAFYAGQREVVKYVKTQIAKGKKKHERD